MGGRINCYSSSPAGSSKNKASADFNKEDQIGDIWDITGRTSEI